MYLLSDRLKLWRFTFRVYLLILIFAVFFTPNRYLLPMQQYHYHFIPLDTTLDGLKGPRGQHFWSYWTEYFGNLIGNVFLFVPMGFLLSALQSNKSKWQVLLIGITVSIGIELIQLLFKIGVCDVDDVLLNGLGTLVGVWIFRGLKFKAVK